MEKLSIPVPENVTMIQFSSILTNLKIPTDWMENIRDWCISRQLWWGHQIPAFFYGEGKEDFIVAPTKEEAKKT